MAIYRGLDIGSAKPSAADRERIPHHGLDVLDPDQPSTAGDYARLARAALGEIRKRGAVPIIAGGTGLYLRALIDGLAPALPRDEAMRGRLRAHAARRGATSLHRILQRCDPQAAGKIHPNDVPKLIRSLEVSILGRRPQTEQWQAGRDPLRGFSILQLGLTPPRSALYERINDRAKAMFTDGLLEETAAAKACFGESARALVSLGYAQALAVLSGHQTLPDAIAEAQQGHRNYAKRQLTWFRRDPRVHWLQGLRRQSRNPGRGARTHPPASDIRGRAGGEERMTGVRIDKWLWAARFFKTRAIAVKACELSRVKSNGQIAKPAREVKVGDHLEITTDSGLHTVQVLKLSEVRGPASEAQLLFFESDESQAARAKAQGERKAMLAFERLPALKPTGKDRRQLTRLRGRG